MVVIETAELTKRYSGDSAVIDLDLEVEDGEVYGFLGPNGAGKSTTIDMLMNYTRPSAGTLTVLGLDAQQDVSEIHARTGILPDQFGVYSTLTDGDTSTTSSTRTMRQATPKGFSSVSVC